MHHTMLPASQLADSIVILKSHMNWAPKIDAWPTPAGIASGKMILCDTVTTGKCLIGLT